MSGCEIIRRARTPSRIRYCPASGQITHRTDIVPMMLPSWFFEPGYAIYSKKYYF